MEDDFGDEEIRELSHSEYEALTASIRAAREAARGKPEKKSTATADLSHNAPSPKAPAAAEHQANHNGQLSQEAMELGRQIWQSRKQGKSIYEVHRKLGIDASPQHA
jgi:hypothetical protein